MISDHSPALHRSRRRRWQRDPRVVTAGVLTALAGFVLLGSDVHSGLDASRPGRVQVRAGDTIWSIAAAHYQGGDVRDHVDQIITLNHLGDASISPGETLVLPAP